MVRPKKASSDSVAESGEPSPADHPTADHPGQELPRIESPTPETPAAGEMSPPAGELSPAATSSWNTRIGGGWTDAEVGVHLNEDHRNRRTTIKFDEKPSEAIRKLIKEEHGYRFDGENQLWYKRMNPATARQHRTEAEQVAFEVANLIRQERGLAQKSTFSIAV